MRVTGQTSEGRRRVVMGYLFSHSLPSRSPRAGCIPPPNISSSSWVASTLLRFWELLSLALGLVPSFVDFPQPYPSPFVNSLFIKLYLISYLSMSSVSYRTLIHRVNDSYHEQKTLPPTSVGHVA